MSCNNTIKQTCGDTTYATCVKFESSVSENSELFGETCLDAEEVIIDLYSLHDSVKEEINVSTLENTCITFTEPKTAASVITQMYAKLCELESLIEAQELIIAEQGAAITELQSQTCP